MQNKKLKHKSKPKRGRKSPNRLTLWEKKFSKKLKKHHGTYAKKTFHRLMKKSSICINLIGILYERKKTSLI